MPLRHIEVVKAESPASTKERQVFAEDEEPAQLQDLGS